MPITTYVEAPKERYQSRSGKWRERGSTARFEVTGARHAEASRQAMTSAAGSEKPLTGHTTCGRRWIAPRNSTEVVLTGLARERTFIFISSTVQRDVFLRCFLSFEWPQVDCWMCLWFLLSLVCSILCTIRYT